jgi:site-specific recombinase XerD
MRHTATELWFSAGASMEDVRRLLNHKSSESTKRYAHRTEDQLNSLAELITVPQPLLRVVG